MFPNGRAIVSFERASSQKVAPRGLFYFYIFQTTLAFLNFQPFPERLKKLNLAPEIIHRERGHPVRNERASTFAKVWIKIDVEFNQTF